MNYLDEIISQRKKDLDQYGPCLNQNVPETRTRAQPIPILQSKDVILEIKRATPSKGDYAPFLDASQTATVYANAHTSHISVLTENHLYKGRLKDITDVCKTVDDYVKAEDIAPIAVIRKDFLIDPEEIDVSYRLGSDAVTLTARMLSGSTLAQMAKRCEQFGMTAIIEVREDEDLVKLDAVCETVNKDFIVVGVDSRDLSNFSIDFLRPVRLLEEIRAIMGEDARIIFESGVRSAEAADFIGCLGFTGLLLGETAVRNPDLAKSLVTSFSYAVETNESRFWTKWAEKIRRNEKEKNGRPLVKICGLARKDDALQAARLGADALGFILWKKSPRHASAKVVREVHAALAAQKQRPFLIAVVVEIESEEGRTALDLVQEGVIDAIQLHGEVAVDQFFKTGLDKLIPHYAAVNLRSEKDLDRMTALRYRGECRILVDAQDGDKIGGTGVQVNRDLVEKVKSKTRLWLAGGITGENVTEVVKSCHPELIDIASGVEKESGIKDWDKLDLLFNNLLNLS